MSDTKTPTFIVSVRDLSLANKLLVVMLQADKEAGGKHGKAAELAMDLAQATGQPARVFVEGRSDSVMVPERWSDSFARLLDAVIASEKLRDHASSVVDDVARLHLLPPDEIRALRSRIPKGSWRAAA